MSPTREYPWLQVYRMDPLPRGVTLLYTGLSGWPQSGTSSLWKACTSQRPKYSLAVPDILTMSRGRKHFCQLIKTVQKI